MALLLTDNTILTQKATQVPVPNHQHPPSAAAPSYANALKRSPPGKRKAKNVSLVFAKNKDTTSEEVKDKLLTALAPSKVNVGMRNAKKLAKGGVN
ncbi:hypothetical protein AVEN_230448-1 [Araneus ventricosus]|uniref:Uncharacterized protein n=1 Tax=Araneus ventricosus TaxID=182803 RepID=A0A4Y2KSW6_ARAVE|nr:hypothetical protein AVEN_230448-1 [Araneus ventricosus]